MELRLDQISDSELAADYIALANEIRTSLRKLKRAVEDGNWRKAGRATDKLSKQLPLAEFLRSKINERNTT